MREMYRKYEKTVFVSLCLRVRVRLHVVVRTIVRVRVCGVHTYICIKELVSIKFIYELKLTQCTRDNKLA